MRVFVLHKDCSSTPWEVAHLYEHWFIQGFFEYVEQQLGIDRGVIGYLGGETYKNDVFIEGWFYDDAIADLFATYIGHTVINQNLLPLCIDQCATEDREDWRVTDKELLTRQLLALHNVKWVSDDQITTREFTTEKANTLSPITIVKTANRYRSLTVIINLSNATLEERAVFMRFYVVVSDIIGRYNQCQGCYEHDTLPPRRDASGTFFINSLVVRRGGKSNTEISQDLELYLHTFDIAKNQDVIDAHFKIFAAEPLWKGRLREDLQLREIVVSNQAIADSATPDRLMSILQKLDITVTTVDYAFAKNLHV